MFRFPEISVLSELKIAGQFAPQSSDLFRQILSVAKAVNPQMSTWGSNATRPMPRNSLWACQAFGEIEENQGDDFTWD